MLHRTPRTKATSKARPTLPDAMPIAVDPTGAVPHLQKPRPIDQNHHGDGAYEVSDIGDEPVAQQRHRAHLAVGPAHDDQGIAGEKLGAADQYQHETETEGNSTQQTGRAEAEAAIGHDHRIEHGAEGNEGAGQNGKRRQRDKFHIGLGDAYLLDAPGDFRRRHRRRRRRGRGVVRPSCGRLPSSSPPAVGACPQNRPRAVDCQFWGPAQHRPGAFEMALARPVGINSTNECAQTTKTVAPGVDDGGLCHRRHHRRLSGAAYRALRRRGGNHPAQGRAADPSSFAAPR